MVEEESSSPRVVPARPKGSGLLAPRVLLGLLVVIGLAVLVSFGIGVLLLRG